MIRPYRLSDYDVWREAYGANAPKNIFEREQRKESELTPAKFRAIVRQQGIERKKDRFYSFGVFARATGELVGIVTLMGVMRLRLQSAELGYAVFNRHWGKGFGTEAVKACLDIGFRDLKLHRIEAGIEPANKRSLALAKSLKMRPEGLRKRYVFLRGKWVDIRFFALTTEDVRIRFRGKAVLPPVPLS